MRVGLNVLVVGLWLTLSLSSSAQELHDPQKAFQVSAETKRPVLLIFSGSDWCAPCIRFEKTIIAQEAFQAYAREHLVILKADFPQRKKLPRAEAEQNQALAEKYNPQGLFPFVLLLTSAGASPITLDYNHKATDEFIAEINAALIK
jgi:thiol-disulfide isomerase/thioredoxin